MKYCHAHDLKYVAVWVDGHCAMLRRCKTCKQFEVGYVLTTEPFRNSTNIDIDQLPRDLLQHLRVVVSRIKPEKANDPILSFPM